MTDAIDRTLDLYAGRRVYVVGLARSGMASARALRAGGAEVLCWDDGDAARNAAAEDGFTLAAPDVEDTWRNVSALVLAPGIPFTHPVPHRAVTEAKARGVEIVSDIELLFRAEPDAKFVGITGTNGKSTTTALLGHLLRHAGMDVAVGGNLGIAALTLPKAPLYVLEVSSYQADIIPSAMFDIGVLLNITPDHLDRHGGMDGYIAAKRRVLRPRTPDSVAVIGTDAEPTASIADELLVEGRAVQRISLESPPVAAFVDAGRCPALVGDHGKQNAAAALAVARLLGVSESVALEGLGTFPGLAHRQERIATLDGVTYINDSKATNAEAAARAVSSYRGIHWIAGGVGKDGGYTPLDPYIANIDAAYLIGEAAPAIADWIAGRVPVTMSGDLAAAIAEARAGAMKQDTPGPVLLSPACASFDQFTSFEARGDAFRALVLDLPANSREIHSVKEAA
jgi:UDP-N-acetylmuramoylalanine--D-glutamate ligase